MGRELGHMTKNECLMELSLNIQNSMKLIFSNSPHHHKGLELGSSAQNNEMSITKVLVNYPKAFPIWRLPNMEFSVQIYTQFLQKKNNPMNIDPHTVRGGFSEPDFCMQIWKFHAILSKKMFL